MQVLGAIARQVALAGVFLELEPCDDEGLLRGFLVVLLRGRLVLLRALGELRVGE